MTEYLKFWFAQFIADTVIGVGLIVVFAVILMIVSGGRK